METRTRYDSHRDVSSNFNFGTSSTEVMNTNLLGVRKSIGTHNFSSTFDEDIVIEILSRLPVKSLMQFKLVCKHWLFLIEQDQYFIDLHFNRSKARPKILYIDPLQEKRLHPSRFNESKTLRQNIDQGSGGGGGDEVESIISKVRITDDEWFPYSEVLEPVNGLVCFVDTETNGVRVYNASTREATPWITSTLLAEEIYKLEMKDSKMKLKSRCSAVYQFGFDPAKKEHKLFCFWRLVARPRRHRYCSMERPDYQSWEALTVGRDTKWRRINAVPNENNQIKIKEVLPPPYSCRRQVYADGTIYWTNKAYRWNEWGDSYPDDPEVIVAFDVGSETYRVIPIPSFILDEPREEKYSLPIDMLVLGGHVALLYRVESYVIKLWMLDDRANKKLENCRGNKSNWSAETITLPFCCDNGTGGFGIAGSRDKILFECRRRETETFRIFVCLYSYDRRKKTCKKIEMDGFSSFALHSWRSLVTTFTESLFSVQSLDKIKVSDDIFM